MDSQQRTTQWPSEGQVSDGQFSEGQLSAFANYNSVTNGIAKDKSVTGGLAKDNSVTGDSATDKLDNKEQLSEGRLRKDNSVKCNS